MFICQVSINGDGCGSEGFAHSFVTLSKDGGVFLYKTTNYYCVASDRGVAWNDEQLAVTWPVEGINLILSDKDQKQPIFKLAEYF